MLWRWMIGFLFGPTSLNVRIFCHIFRLGNRAIQRSGGRRVHCEGQEKEKAETRSGGEGGIRTLGRGFNPYSGLANRRLQPLGHLSSK